MRHPLRHRLYLQVYLGIVAVGLLCLLAAGLAGWATSSSRAELPRPVMRGMQLLAEELPHDDPEALSALAEDLGVELALWSEDGQLIGVTEKSFSKSSPPQPGQWLHGPGGPGLTLQLDDGRVLMAYEAHAHSSASLLRVALVFLALAGAVAVGSYPLARRVTRRVEALRAASEEWGAGDLSARVPVEGTDEVAQLAQSFNRAADRVEALVDRQRRVLASASHELRSPLARLRMAIELTAEGEHDAAMLSDAVADIEELDALIGDLLMASRADVGAPPLAQERVDLSALLVEEAPRVGARLRPPEGGGAGGGAGDGAGSGETPVEVLGDARMLRRALRNLLENAQRHGGGADVEASLEVRGGRARVEVADRGPGVPAEVQARIFEPFFRPAGHREGADGGVGLGLALVTTIAERHGGAVRYRDREGGGSVFELELPLG